VAQSREDIIAWVASHVLPHEAAVRGWLRRWTRCEQDIDDVIQEAYCRLAALEDVSHVGNGRAYLFQTTRNLVLEHARRSKIVRIHNVSDLAALNIVDDAPGVDRVVGGARDLQRVEELIDGLPVKCRRVFVLRRVYGESQREIAKKLGMTEGAVEKQTARGVKLILNALQGEDVMKDLKGELSERSKDRTRGR
jgi:RNA polymerase sigma factor (sigma-70 family)